MPENGNHKTAFVLAGGGRLGAVQVGMLKALTGHDILPDFVVGASVGAINSACFAAQPNKDGVARIEELWVNLRRADVFPLSATGSVLGLIGRQDHLIASEPLRSVIESAIPYQRLEEA